MAKKQLRWMDGAMDVAHLIGLDLLGWLCKKSFVLPRLSDFFFFEDDHDYDDDHGNDDALGKVSQEDTSLLRWYIQCFFFSADGRDGAGTEGCTCQKHILTRLRRDRGKQYVNSSAV